MKRIVLILAAGLCCCTFAADWPVYMGDSARSGISPEALELTGRPAWIYEAAQSPSPGFYSSKSEDTLGPQKIRAMANTYDYAFAPVIANDRLYFGSSTEDAFFCLDAVSGKELWRFYTEGAVRLAAAVHDGLVIFGCDDGIVYALDAESGAPKWKFSAAPEPRQIIANGRPGSQWPVRTGITMDETGTAYFSAGLFPASGGVTLFAVNAKTGDEIWRREIELPPQGYILKEGDTLYVPNGRASPAEYSAKDGSPLAFSDLRREGGSSFVALADDMVTYGPTEFGIVRFQASKEGAPNNRQISGKLTGLEGRRVLFAGDMFYFLRENSLEALPKEQFRKTLTDSARFFKKHNVRSKSAVQLATDEVAEKEIDDYTHREVPVENARSMILAGDTLVVGAEGRLYAFDKESGKSLLDVEIDGTVWELAASGGRLYASTDTGKIYCFGKTAEKSGVISAEKSEPYAEERLTAARAQAASALKEADTKKGFILAAGLTDGALALEMAKQSDFFVVAVTADKQTARTVRDKLTQTGLYGSRIAVRLHEDGTLPYIPYFANLIVFEDEETRFNAADMERLLQPCGGALIKTDGSVTRRGPLEGGGDWTHMYATPANTSCSGDELVGGLKYRVQWFGNPGDFRQVGWHGNGMGPLAKDGRLYVIKVDSIEAVDSYNGVQIWQRDVPGSARFNPGREGGAACVDEQKLYLAVQNDCRVYDVETGEQVAQFFVPESGQDWGTIARAGDLLFGTTQKRGATTASYPRDLHSMWMASEPEFAVSERLFALDAESGAAEWIYHHEDRVIFNATVTIGDDRVYFIESREKEIVDDADGSVQLRSAMNEEVYLVALERDTGEPVWEQPFEFPTRTMLYLSLQDDTLVASGGYHVGPMAEAEPSLKAAMAIARELNLTREDIQETKIHFIFRALDAKSGKTLWDAGYTSDGYFGNQHNYNVGHPVITPTDIWHAPGEQYLARIDLKTGAVKEYSNINRGKGCATPTGSAKAMFYRSLAIASFDFETEKQFYISKVNRPSCWMSILPANGLVQMPEYSYGCNCAFPLQTSIVLIPENP